MLIRTGYFVDGNIYYLSTAEKKGLYRIQEGARGGGLYLAFVGSIEDCEDYISQKNAMLRKRF